MKHPLLFLSLTGLICLAACGSSLTPDQLSMAVQTLTAVSYTPTPSATPDPDESAIVILLNRGLVETGDPLSQTIEARYQVLEAGFPADSDGSLSTFQVDVRCECAGTSACCTAERMFIVLTSAMRAEMQRIIRQVPKTVASLRVDCHDHATRIGMIMVAWQDMLGYLRGTVNGFQLGARIVKFDGP
jgi:hypothetical protein